MFIFQTNVQITADLFLHVQQNIYHIIPSTPQPSILQHWAAYVCFECPWLIIFMFAYLSTFWRVQEAYCNSTLPTFFSTIIYPSARSWKTCKHNLIKTAILPSLFNLLIYNQFINSKVQYINKSCTWNYTALKPKSLKTLNCDKSLGNDILDRKKNDCLSTALIHSWPQCITSKGRLKK